MWSNHGSSVIGWSIDELVYFGLQLSYTRKLVLSSSTALLSWVIYDSPQPCISSCVPPCLVNLCHSWLCWPSNVCRHNIVEWNIIMHVEQIDVLLEGNRTIRKRASADASPTGPNMAQQSLWLPLVYLLIKKIRSSGALDTNLNVPFDQKTCAAWWNAAGR